MLWGLNALVIHPVFFFRCDFGAEMFILRGFFQKKKKKVFVLLRLTG